MFAFFVSPAERLTDQQKINKCLADYFEFWECSQNVTSVHNYTSTSTTF